MNRKYYLLPAEVFELGEPWYAPSTIEGFETEFSECFKSTERTYMNVVDVNDDRRVVDTYYNNEKIRPTFTSEEESDKWISERGLGEYFYTFKFMRLGLPDQDIGVDNLEVLIVEDK